MCYLAATPIAIKTRYTINGKTTIIVKNRRLNILFIASVDKTIDINPKAEAQITFICEDNPLVKPEQR